MKKLVALAIVLILCLSISGCGNSKSDDVNSVMRNHNYKNDVIKFDDIEWLTELSKVEKKIKNDLLTTTGINRKEIKETYLDSYDNVIGQILYFHNDIDDYKDGKSIGKLAGWDIVAINILYIEYMNEKYVVGYSIAIINMNDKTNVEQIKLDLVDKLDTKYGKENRYIDSGWYEYEWREQNNNIVAIFSDSEVKDMVRVVYQCMDADDNLDKLVEIENKNKKTKEGERINNDSNGL